MPAKCKISLFLRYNRKDVWKMKRIGLFFCLMALLTACSVDDADSYDAQPSMDAGIQNAVYDGEWTVNKQVVDTARLEVTDALKLRLPEDYLAALCFPDKSGASTPKPKGQPVVIQYRNQGYSTAATFSDFVSTEKSFGGWVNFNQASFIVAIDNVDYRVDLFCDVTGSAIYRHDTGLWTIAIPIGTFLITNLQTQEESECRLPSTITIYYNAKQRIR